MLCIQLKSHIRGCGAVSGGIANIALFDPFDFDFTQAADVNGDVQPYTAIAPRTAGSGGAGTAVLSSGTVGAINVTSGGTGYSVAPNVTFTGGSGTGAAATAQVANGVIIGFTITSPGTGYTSAPTVVLTAVANTGKVYPISFQKDQAEWKWSQSQSNGCSVKYDHELDFQLPDNSQTLTQFLTAVDKAACCCGLGFIIRLTNGKIFIAGERFANGEEITYMTMVQNGSSGTSGKLIDDFNGGNLVFKGSYTRTLFEYTGAWSTVTALNG